MNILSLLKNKLVQFLGAIMLALSFLFGAIRYGKKTQQDQERVKKMENYIKTKETIDEVDTSDDRDAAIDRMRRNGWL